MPAMTKLGFLSLLSTAVLAVPTPLDVFPSGTAPAQAHGTGHFHYHAGNASDSVYPSGTGRHRHRKHRITTTSTLTSTAVFTQYVTVSPSPAAEPAVAAAAVQEPAEANPSSSPCSTPTVYQTAVNVVTVTVEENTKKTPDASAPAPYVASSAAPAAPAAGYNTGSTDNEADTPSASKPEAVSLTFKPKGKEVSATNAAADVVAAAGAAVNGAAAAVETTVASAVGGSSKRGVAYNDLQYTGCFTGKKVSWAYNWGQVAGSLDSSFEYVPMLWGTRSDFTANWVGNAKNAISGGSKNILSFNEPDLAAQSNMDPGTAAGAYKTFIHNNFANSGVRLGSPAVTNGGGDMGLTWLNNFLSACSGCQVDFVVIHWYDSATNVQYFKDHVTQAHTSTGKPVWITEFGATGSDADINNFLQQVLPWLDSQDFVERYSYFMARDGLLNAGTGLSPHGNTYATY